MDFPYHIECGGYGLSHDDYYALSREEVQSLLEIAREKKINLLEGRGTSLDVMSVSSIQVRLVQAICGMTCPRPITGNVSQKMNKLESLYVNWIQGERVVSDGLIDTVLGCF